MAWTWEDNEGVGGSPLTRYSDVPPGRITNATPLYTHPPAAEPVWKPCARPFSFEDDRQFIVRNSAGFCGVATVVDGVGNAFNETPEEQIGICSDVTEWCELPHPAAKPAEGPSLPMVVGWAYAFACSAADEGRDIRQITAPEMLEAAQRDLAPRYRHPAHDGSWAYTAEPTGALGEERVL